MALRTLAKGFMDHATSQRAPESLKMLRRSFAGKNEPLVYVVFGAAGAVGSDLVGRLVAQSGAQVFASDRDTSDLDKLKEATIVPADTLDQDAVANVIAKAAEAHGRVDGVASCVGSMLIKPAHLTSTEEFVEIMQENALSAFHILKGSVGAMMSSGGGSIVLCSSSIAHRGMANHDALAAAKGAVSSLALSAASTYSPHNIRVNVCVPGVIEAKMTEKLTESDDARDASERMIALGRLGTPGDVGRALEFLLHPNNAYITGTFLHVDGGLGSMAPARAGDSKTVKQN
ncbi:NAD(P)-binding protein [Coccomyxa subellipsoidea C-169]|uniref:NAD(P)-binding protein n=1 Tax=Coccomyxa subellipsoidea (strain C-169) TaxID=574566 RepID=I0YSJ9_COCSC|nr:NAD(P)-binding protein [Coccomyxa subellipsoidea C-169]EIE21368.1 NAD(P)-binding protein [Coccomyxa subellipsoidea C-169]|eukprot:XP_005645912.1 NAD(P)-binding protein [Coccomyxa subellipsoidea C-169]